MTQREEIERLAADVRAFLEPHWAAWHARAGSPEGRRTLSEGTCGRSSVFLVGVLREAGFKARAAFGSPVECDCGYRTERGWKGHGWVVVEEPATIVDVTADQILEDPATGEMWLRSVQQDTSNFLAIKFSMQLQQEEGRQ